MISFRDTEKAMTTEEARKICEAATEGPWFAEEVDRDGLTWVDDGRTGDDKLFPFKCETSDAQFIAAARTGWPEALDEIDRLQAENERLTTRLKAAEGLLRESEGWLDALICFDNNDFIELTPSVEESDFEIEEKDTRKGLEKLRKDISAHLQGGE